MKLHAMVAAFALVTLTSSAFAQEGESVRVRGTLDAIDGDALMVTSTAGEKFTINMTENTGYRALELRSWDDVKPGTFLASAGERRDDGKLYAVEVRIFEQGGNARQFDFDLGPNSVMTNAPVAEVMSVDDGNVVKVSLPDGDAEYIIEPDVPITVQVSVDRTVLEAGKFVVINATKLADGSYIARSISAEQNGLKPGN